MWAQNAHRIGSWMAPESTSGDGSDKRETFLLKNTCLDCLGCILVTILVLLAWSEHQLPFSRKKILRNWDNRALGRSRPPKSQICFWKKISALMILELTALKFWAVSSKIVRAMTNFSWKTDVTLIFLGGSSYKNVFFDSRKSRISRHDHHECPNRTWSVRNRSESIRNRKYMFFAIDIDVQIFFWEHLSKKLDLFEVFSLTKYWFFYPWTILYGKCI